MLMTALGSRVYQLFIRFLMILRNSDPEFTELMSGVLGVWWGWQLLNPLAVTFDGGRGWTLMAALAPEEFWGLVYVAGGVFQLAALAVASFRLRWLAAFCGLVSWLLVAGMIGVANPSGTGLVTYSVIAISQGWACWRIALEAP